MCYSFKMLKIVTPVWTAIKFFRFEFKSWWICSEIWWTARGKWMEGFTTSSGRKVLCPLLPSYIRWSHVGWPTLWKQIRRCRCITSPIQTIFHPFQNRRCWPHSLALLHSVLTCLWKYLALWDWRWHILWATKCQINCRAIRNPTPTITHHCHIPSP